MRTLSLVAVLLLAGVSQGQERARPPLQFLNYKVICAPLGGIEAVELDPSGKPLAKTILGEREPAAAMTVQFDALAAKGWEFVSPVATGNMTKAGPKGSQLEVPCVYLLFKKVIVSAP